MKTFIFSAFSFLCLIVCSCDKTSHQDLPQTLIIGDWQVRVSTEVGTSIAGEKETKLEDICYYSFESNGRMVITNSLSKKTELFYYYDDVENAIVLETDKSILILKIDVLTKDSFVFHNTQSLFGISTTITYRGTKINKS